MLEAVDTGHKRRKMKYRLASLARAHVDDAQLEDAVEIIWDIRSRTVHEGFGAGVAALEQDVTAEVLDMTRYLFLVSVMYALDQNQSGCSIDDLWRGVSRYTPSVRLGIADIPPVTDIVEVFRR